MSESKMVTEREAVLREREAYIAGVRGVRGSDEDQFRGSRRGVESMAEEAARLYPLPKVERPRVVVETSVHGRTVAWKYDQGALWWRNARHGNGEWRNLAAPGTNEMFITPERVKLLADLLANPTELVEDTP